MSNEWPPRGWVPDGEEPAKAPSIEALAAEVTALNKRVAELESRPQVDPQAVAAELDRLQQEREALPAAQAKRFVAECRERDRARSG